MATNSPFCHLQIDTAQRMHRNIAHLIGLGQTTNFNHHGLIHTKEPP